MEANQFVDNYIVRVKEGLGHVCHGSAYAVLHYEGAPDPYNLEFNDEDFVGVNTTHETEVS